MSSDFQSQYESYQAAHKWLLSLITDPEGNRYKEQKTPQQRQAEFEVQLARMQAFLDFADNPEKKFNSIHIAGTSGKGSVSVMLAEILQASGYDTGYHISPYLQTPLEKLIQNGRLITLADFTRLIDDFKGVYAGWLQHTEDYVALKYGEAWVGLTYFWLAQAGVDWGVVETGLGGRYDPTNVLPADLSIITNINYDHVESLGPTLVDIANHKAGIIKPNTLVITGETQPSPWNVIWNEAQEKNARLYSLNRDFAFFAELVRNETVLEVTAPHRKYKHIKVGLLGQHQASNAAVAIAAADVLAKEFDLSITEESVRQAIASVNFPGRMEVVQTHPTVMLDGAHNPHKMTSLVNSVKTLYRDKRITVIIGSLASKNALGMLTPLLQLQPDWVVTQPHVLGKPATSPAEMANLVRNLDPEAGIVEHDNVQAALDYAIETVGPDGLILVTGSIYLLGEARERWRPTLDILKTLV